MNDLKNGQFAGFQSPSENWSKLPHQFIECLPMISSLGELKIILYVLRHTWGYNDDHKRISLSEFQDGRKTKNGDRIDSGVGMSLPSIRLGIKKAIDHGFLIVHEDATDLARIKRYYSLRGKVSLPLDERNFTPDVKKLYPDHRKKLKKETEETKDNNAFTVYSSEIGILTSHIADRLGSLIDDYPEEWVVDAIKIASGNNARNLKYIETILSNWQNKGRDYSPGKDRKNGNNRTSRKEPEETVPTERDIEIAAAIAAAGR